MYGISVIGNVVGSHFIEDIRLDIPHRVVVHVPADMVRRSRDLSIALSQNKITQLKGALPAGAVMSRGGLGAIPGHNAPRTQGQSAQQISQQNELKKEIARLTQELEASKQRESQLRALNEGLQTTLTTMSGQLGSIQVVLEELKKQGIQVSTMPVVREGSNGIDGSAPMFVTSVKREDAKVNIAVEKKTSTTDLSASREALRKLREGRK